jgi:hypothetical protein
MFFADAVADEHDGCTHHVKPHDHRNFGSDRAKCHDRRDCGVDLSIVFEHDCHRQPLTSGSYAGSPDERRHSLNSNWKQRREIMLDAGAVERQPLLFFAYRLPRAHPSCWRLAVSGAFGKRECSPPAFEAGQSPGPPILSGDLLCTNNCQNSIGINAYVIHQHFGGERCGVVGRSGVVSTHSQVHDDEVGLTGVIRPH